MTPQVLAGKVGVVFGVANKRSIGEFGEGTPLHPCDAAKDTEIADFFGKVRTETDRLDLLLHSVAFAPKEALEGDFVSTTREAAPMMTSAQPV